MADVIWTKAATYGTVEVTRSDVTVNGALVGHAGQRASAIAKPIVKDGRTYTHLIGTRVALTADEAASYDAAMAAELAARVRTAPAYVPTAAGRAEDLTRPMSREHSAL